MKNELINSNNIEFDNDSTVSSFENFYVTYAIIGKSTFADLKDILDFASKHGKIVYKKLRSSDAKLYVTDVQPCPEIDGDEP